ncbi:type I-E CRISPR-associated protein Cas6/Cse3/CasE [Streptomonospora salina]|uniref:CRISPR system Cascade subunit CasE n=1 Tax=Streptomonospora salina TaxID=104205 RepID=A0A841EFF1_9ACTN|nr:type I-E CRISPR-associated protein Cas6/Cse3/CasE [Streptomonospora salina]MBB6000059.1 CRISPR system Cascade subunit CasE [Streptomonospora salina]
MTLLLHRIRLDTANRGVARASAGDHHRMLTKALGPLPSSSGQGARQAAGLLFRDETTRAGRCLIVQSQTPLDHSALGPGYTLDASRDISAVLEVLDQEPTLRYRIVAAPVKRLGKTKQQRELRTEDGERLSSKEHTTALRGAAAEEWWQRKAEDHGLGLRSVNAGEAEDTADPRRGIRLPAVCFDGLATVTDPQAARRALTEGIGRGKAFGLGLLSLAPGE